MPKFVVILTSNKPIDKARGFGLGRRRNPTLAAFTPARRPEGARSLPRRQDARPAPSGPRAEVPRWLRQEPDRLADERGLDAGPRPGTPSMPSCSSTRCRARMLNGPEAQEFAPLLAARKSHADGRPEGEGIERRRLGPRSPDAGAAGRAKDSVQKVHRHGRRRGRKGHERQGPARTRPASRRRSRKPTEHSKDAKVEVSGSDLTVAGSYKANFDIGTMVGEAVKKIQDLRRR